MVKAGGLEPAPFEYCQPTGQPDGEGREKNMIRDRESKLNARQQGGI
jgi:hypothetical protein